MEKSTLQIGLKRIHENFAPKQYSAETVRVAWEAIQNEDDACMKPAVDKLIIESAPGIMPPISKLINNIRDVAISKRENQSQNENYSAPRLKDVEPATEYGRECLNLITAIFDGRIDKKEYLVKAFRLIDKHNRPKDECLWIDDQCKGLYF